jgi:hypothetical protein
MKSLARALVAAAAAVVLAAPLVYEAAGQDAGQRIRRGQPAGAPPTSFSKDVMPIFRANCLQCHQPGGAGYEKSGVDLRTYDGVMKGTKFGAVISPKEPEFSSLMRLLDGQAAREIQMPHNMKRLPQEQRAVIRRWILEGAQNN